MVLNFESVFCNLFVFSIEKFLFAIGEVIFMFYLCGRNRNNKPL